MTTTHRREPDRAARPAAVLPSPAVRTSLPCLISIVALAACGGDDEAVPTDAAEPDAAPLVDAGIDAGFVPPTLLSETGLYSDLGNRIIAAGVLEYAPRWELWSDDAAKRRWIALPPGTQIDSADMDHWSFPIGTKLWKEFRRGGRLIETRLLQKIGPSNDWADWFAVSFQWNAGETEAMAVPGGVIDEAGHDDIPARSDCRKCHVNTRVPSVIIGFSALQLDTPPPGSGFATLQTLVDGDLLTVDPPAPATAGGPSFPLPAGDVARDALGYLHANCGNCHNAASDVQPTVTLQLRLTTAALGTWATTAPYLSTVGVTPELTTVGATALVAPGSHTASAVWLRLNAVLGSGISVMPPVGRETADPTGADLVRLWIQSL